MQMSKVCPVTIELRNVPLASRERDLVVAILVCKRAIKINL